MKNNNYYDLVHIKLVVLSLQCVGSTIGGENICRKFPCVALIASTTDYRTAFTLKGLAKALREPVWPSFKALGW